MRLEYSETEYLELKFCERGTVGIPYDCQLALRLQSDFVQGHIEAWIDGPEMEHFLKQLKVLDSQQKGEACLSSSSPDALLIEIKPLDSLGNFIFKVKVGHRYYVHSEMSLASAEAAFPLTGQSVSDVCKHLVLFFEQALCA